MADNKNPPLPTAPPQPNSGTAAATSTPAKPAPSKAAKPPSKDKPEDKVLWKNKKVQKFVEILKSPIALGVLITLVFLYVTNTYYTLQNEMPSERLKHSGLQRSIFTSVQYFHEKVSDIRFRVRGEIPASEKIALLAIDDPSITEIGRWPWSREKIAFIVEEMMKYGASAIGFDIVFAEPQLDQTIKFFEGTDLATLPPQLKDTVSKIREAGHPDEILGRTIAKYKDRIVLGAFGESGNETFGLFQPYEDYCRNEAYNNNIDEFIDPSPNLAVKDKADPYMNVDFSKFFQDFFQQMEESTWNEEVIKEYYPGKTSLVDIPPEDFPKVNYLVNRKKVDYCQKWGDDFRAKLDGSDPQLTKQITSVFEKLFAPAPEMAAAFTANPAAGFDWFSKSVLPIPIDQKLHWAQNVNDIRKGAAFTGPFDASQDDDGTIRKASMFFRTGNNVKFSYIPTLSLQTYLVASKYRAEMELDIDPKNKNQKKLTRFAIVDPKTNPPSEVQQVPVDSQGRVLINYAGPSHSYYHVPAKELFNKKETMVVHKFGRLDNRTGIKDIEVKKAEFIKDKAFVFGATAIGVYDLRVTPFDANFPGPETHVNTIGNLFQKNLIKSHPSEPAIMLFLVLIVGILISYSIAATSAVAGFLIIAGSFGIIAFLDWWFFAKYYFVSADVILGGLIIFLYIFLFFYKYFTEERKKKYLKSTFSKYVSPAIVDEILKDPENIELGGKKQGMTVFFSDVRGFTTLSEKLDPRDLSDVLNLYLTPMTNIVFSNKGTLDKYIGDAVMAFFGAPIFYQDHAVYACKCALQSITKLFELQPMFQKLFADKGINDATIDIGIGLNTGEMSVGNMGSDIVRNYTVMGDAVNLGARLEGITKQYGVRIVISEFTWEQVKDKFATRELDWVKVKGKHKPVRIFELIAEGVPDAKTQQLIEHFNSGFNLYHERKFVEAIAEFKQVLEVKATDKVSKLYIEWCEEWIKEPPPEDWDGVTEMKTK